MIIDKNFSPIMEKVFQEKSLSTDEAQALGHSLLNGTLSDIRIAAVLTGFRFLPLSEDYILAILNAISEKNPKVETAEIPKIVDCGGTGGDSSNTVNISTTASIVAAAAGAQIAKFAGKSISSKSGSSDVLKMLDVHPANSTIDAYESIKKHNIAFMSSHSFYPHLKHLSHIRKTLGFRTIVDLVFPLANPIRLSGQLIGVYCKKSLPVMINCLKILGRNRALVAYGEDGQDELSVTSSTSIAMLDNGQISHQNVKPEDFGLPTHQFKDLLGKDIEYNSKIILDVLRNDANQAIIDAVKLNAAATLWCAEKCDNIKSGISMAENAIVSKKALKILEKWKNKKTSERK